MRCSGVGVVLVGAALASLSQAQPYYCQDWAYVIQSPLQDNYFGWCIANAGDVDGDDIDDLIVGSPGLSTDGRAYLYSGTDGSLLCTFYPDQNAISKEEFGAAVGGVGDVDGDGTPDIVVGSHIYDYLDTFSGAVYVFDGGEAAEGTAVLIGDAIIGGSEWRLGAAIASAGDIDGDERSEMVVCAATLDSGSDYGAFEAVVFDFANGQWSAIRVIEGADDVSANVEAPECLALLGDVDGDGSPEIAFGESQAFPYYQLNGWAFVYATQTGDEVASFEGEADHENFGWAVRSAGDVTGDGTADLVVGVPGRKVVYGSTIGCARVYEMPSGDFVRQLNGIELIHEEEDIGYTVAGVGDVNGDGYMDLASGAGLAAYTFSGRTGEILQVFDVAGVRSMVGGDFNGDSLGDFALGTGNDYVYVFLGRATVACDMNCDGSVNGFDVDPFLLALSDREDYHREYPCCDVYAGDANNDGSVNGFDVDDFLDCLGG